MHRRIRNVIHKLRKVTKRERAGISISETEIIC